MANNNYKIIVSIFVAIIIIIAILLLINYLLCRNKICIAGICLFGKCKCKSGYDGSQCDPCVKNTADTTNITDDKKKCQENCVHGTCNKRGQCKCQKGWIGDKCDQWNSKYS